MAENEDASSTSSDEPVPMTKARTEELLAELFDPQNGHEDDVDVLLDFFPHHSFEPEATTVFLSHTPQLVNLLAKHEHDTKDDVANDVLFLLFSACREASVDDLKHLLGTGIENKLRLAIARSEGMEDKRSVFMFITEIFKAIAKVHGLELPPPDFQSMLVTLTEAIDMFPEDTMICVDAALQLHLYVWGLAMFSSKDNKSPGPILKKLGIHKTLVHMLRFAAKCEDEDRDLIASSALAAISDLAYRIGLSSDLIDVDVHLALLELFRTMPQQSKSKPEMRGELIGNAAKIIFSLHIREPRKFARGFETVMSNYLCEAILQAMGEFPTNVTLACFGADLLSARLGNPMRPPGPKGKFPWTNKLVEVMLGILKTALKAGGESKKIMEQVILCLAMTVTEDDESLKVLERAKGATVVMDVMRRLPDIYSTQDSCAQILSRMFQVQTGVDPDNRASHEDIPPAKRAACVAMVRKFAADGLFSLLLQLVVTFTAEERFEEDMLTMIFSAFCFLNEMLDVCPELAETLGKALVVKAVMAAAARLQPGAHFTPLFEFVRYAALVAAEPLLKKGFLERAVDLTMAHTSPCCFLRGANAVFVILALNTKDEDPVDAPSEALHRKIVDLTMTCFRLHGDKPAFAERFISLAMCSSLAKRPSTREYFVKSGGTKAVIAVGERLDPDTLLEAHWPEVLMGVIAAPGGPAAVREQFVPLVRAMKRFSSLPEPVIDACMCVVEDVTTDTASRAAFIQAGGMDILVRAVMQSVMLIFYGQPTHVERIFEGVETYAKDPATLRLMVDKGVIETLDIKLELYPRDFPSHRVFKRIIALVDKL